jgi:hypothetical protein
VTFDCSPALVLAGTVTLPDGSKPKEGTVTVELAEGSLDATRTPSDPSEEEDGEDLDEDDAWFELTDIPLQDGAFRVPGLGPGKYKVTVEVEGAGKAQVVAEAGKTDLRIRLRPGGMVTGRFLLPDGKSAGWVSFELHRAGEKPGDPEESEGEVSDRSGKISLESVAEGSWTLVVESHHARGRTWTGRAEFVVRAGQTTKLPDVTLRDAGPAPKDGEETDEEK